MLSIVNPRYAFLEADYDNPSLAIKNKIVENPIENVIKSEGHRSEFHIATKDKISAVYIQVTSKLNRLLWIPTDILCISFLMLVEILP